MFTRRAACLYAALLLLATSSALAGVADQLDSPDKGWRRGPARYLMTRDEDRDFKKLKTDEERRAFIAGFWTRRDPTPGTEANEFRDRYVRRLEIVEQTFAPPEGRGWEEDRAQVVLLLGPPDGVQVFAGGPAGGDSAAGPGAPLPGAAAGGEAAASASLARATFTYKSEIFPGGPTPAEIEFVGEPTGGFRLVTRLDLTDPRLIGLEPLPIEQAAAPATADAAPALPALPAEPAVEAPSPQQELLDAVLSESPPASQVELVTRLDCYKTQEAAETLATVTVAVQGAGDSPILAARIVDGSGTAVASLDDGDSFTPASAVGEPAGSSALYQAAHNVPPGEYALVTAVKDPATGTLGFRRDQITVPDFHQAGLRLSTVTLARKVEPNQPTGGVGGKFVLGSFKVIPAPSPEFRAGEDLVLYYQVYNTSDDPASSRPKLKVTYKFAKVEPSRRIPLRPIVQDVDAAIQVYGITIADVWPAGDYEVEVQVQDLVAGTSASSVVPFQVKKEG